MVDVSGAEFMSCRDNEIISRSSQLGSLLVHLHWVLRCISREFMVCTS